MIIWLILATITVQEDVFWVGAKSAGRGVGRKGGGDSDGALAHKGDFWQFPPHQIFFDKRGRPFLPSSSPFSPRLSFAYAAIFWVNWLIDLLVVLAGAGENQGYLGAWLYGNECWACMKKSLVKLTIFHCSGYTHMLWSNQNTYYLLPISVHARKPIAV